MEYYDLYKNKVETCEGGRFLRVYLTKGYSCIVDNSPDILKLLTAHRFCVSVQCGYPYACTHVRASDGKLRHTMMHHMIAGKADGMHIDHISRDSLDNRRGNLRVASPSTNARNRATNRRSASGVTGLYRRDKKRLWAVGWMDDAGKWRMKDFSDSTYGGPDGARDSALTFLISTKRNLSKYAGFDTPVELVQSQTPVGSTTK
jgi:hypothetical protein